MDLLHLALILIFGITTSDMRRLTPSVTNVTTCTEGSLTLHIPSETLDRSSIRNLYWKYKYPHDTDWNYVVYCERKLNMTCNVPQNLSDGTGVSIGPNQSLILEYPSQSRCKNHIQFLFGVRLADHTELLHIFDVKFTITRIWTWMDADLNLTKVVLATYPLGQLDEVEFFDANGTNFAYLDTEKGATLNVRDSKRQRPVFWSRLMVTDDGSLMLNRIQRTDNGTEIRIEAQLKSELSVCLRIFKIRVNSPGPSTIIPSQTPSSSPVNVTYTGGPFSLPRPTTATYSNNVSASGSLSSASTVSVNQSGTTPTRNSAPAQANRQHWTVIFTAVMAASFCLLMR